MAKAQEATPRTAWGQLLVLYSENLSKLAVSLGVNLRNLEHRLPRTQELPYQDMLRHLKIAHKYLSTAVKELEVLGYTHSAGGPEDAR